MDEIFYNESNAINLYDIKDESQSYQQDIYEQLQNKEVLEEIQEKFSFLQNQSCQISEKKDVFLDGIVQDINEGNSINNNENDLKSQISSVSQYEEIPVKKIKNSNENGSREQKNFWIEEENVNNGIWTYRKDKNKVITKLLASGGQGRVYYGVDISKNERIVFKQFKHQHTFERERSIYQIIEKNSQLMKRLLLVDNIEFDEEFQVIVLPGAECNAFDFFSVLHKQFLIKLRNEHYQKDQRFLYKQFHIQREQRNLILGLILSIVKTCSALEDIGILYQDLKPENILIQKEFVDQEYKYKFVLCDQGGSILKNKEDHLYGHTHTKFYHKESLYQRKQQQQLGYSVEERIEDFVFTLTRSIQGCIFAQFLCKVSQKIISFDYKMLEEDKIDRFVEELERNLELSFVQLFEEFYSCSSLKQIQSKYENFLRINGIEEENILYLSEDSQKNIEIIKQNNLELVFQNTEICYENWKFLCDKAQFLNQSNLYLDCQPIIRQLEWIINSIQRENLVKFREQKWFQLRIDTQFTIVQYYLNQFGNPNRIKAQFYIQQVENQLVCIGVKEEYIAVLFLQLYVLQGMFYFSSKQVEKSIQSFQKGLQMGQFHVKSHQKSLISLYLGMSQSLIEGQQLGKAFSFIEENKNKLERIKDQNIYDFGLILHLQALILFLKQENQKAFELNKESIRVLESVGGRVNLSIYTVYALMCKLYWKFNNVHQFSRYLKLIYDLQDQRIWEYVIESYLINELMEYYESHLKFDKVIRIMKMKIQKQKNKTVGFGGENKFEGFDVITLYWNLMKYYLKNKDLIGGVQVEQVLNRICEKYTIGENLEEKEEEEEDRKLEGNPCNENCFLFSFQWRLGNMYAENGYFDEGLERCEKALEMCEFNSSKCKESCTVKLDILSILGKMYEEGKQFDRALQAFQKRKSILENLKNKNSFKYDICLNYINIGKQYYYQGFWEKGVEVLLKGVQILESQFGDKQDSEYKNILLKIYRQLSIIYDSENELDKAIYYEEQISEYCLNTMKLETEQKMNELTEMCKIYIKTDQFGKALAVFDLISDIFKQKEASDKSLMVLMECLRIFDKEIENILGIKDYNNINNDSQNENIDEKLNTNIISYFQIIIGKLGCIQSSQYLNLCLKYKEILKKAQKNELASKMSLMTQKIQKKLFIQFNFNQVLDLEQINQLKYILGSAKQSMEMRNFNFSIYLCHYILQKIESFARQKEILRVKMLCYLILQTCYYELNSFEHDYYDQILEISQEINDDISQNSSFNQLFVQVYEQQYEYGKVHSICERAVDQYYSEGNQKSESCLKFMKQMIDNLSNNLNQKEKAIEYQIRFNSIVQEVYGKESEQYVECVFLLAKLYESQLDYPKIRETYYTLNEICKENGKNSIKKFKLGIIQKLAFSYSKEEDFDSGLKHYEYLLKEIPNGGFSQQDIFVVYLKLGQCSQGVKNYDKAIKYYYSGLAFATKCSKIVWQLVLYGKLGELYREMNSVNEWQVLILLAIKIIEKEYMEKLLVYEESISFLNLVLFEEKDTFYQIAQEKERVLQLKVILSATYEIFKNWSKAAQLSRKLAEEIGTNNQKNQKLVKIYEESVRITSNCSQKAKEFPQAKEYWGKMLQIIKQKRQNILTILDLARIWFTLSSIFKELKNDEEVLISLKKAFQIIINLNPGMLNLNSLQLFWMIAFELYSEEKSAISYEVVVKYIYISVTISKKFLAQNQQRSSILYIYNSIGCLMDKMEYWEKSVLFFEASLLISEREFGKNSEKSFLFLVNLSEQYFKLGYNGIGIELFQEASKIWKKYKGKPENYQHAMEDNDHYIKKRIFYTIMHYACQTQI